MENYRVGQVLYVIPAKTANVVPVQVMERRISETASGTAIKHIVKSPKPAAKPLVLETVEGVVFSDLRTARETMVRNATAAIDAMVKHAAGVAQQAFAPPSRPETAQAEDDPFDTSGSFLDEQLPVSNGSAGSHHAIPATIEQQPNYAEPIETDGSGMTEVMTSDGKKRKVRIKAS